MNTLGDHIVHRSRSINPARFPDEIFELYSIPAHDRGSADTVRGSEIGSSKQLVQPGDVLISKIIPHIRRVRIVGPDKGNRQLASGEWIVFRTKEYDPKYLRHYLLSDRFHAQYMNTVAGVGGSLVRARPEFVRKLRAPLPPLDEQRRIAAILDKADAIRTKRRQVLEQLRNLEFALQFEIFGDLRRNSKHWPILPFGRLVVNEDKQRVPLRVADRSLRHGPYPYYGASGIIDFIDDYIFEGKKLLISEDGANLAARTKPIAFIAEGQYWVNNHAHVVSPNSRVNIEYLCAVINKIDISAFVGGSAQPKLTRASLDRLQIPVPPIELQEEYRRKLALIYELKLTSQVMEKASRALFASLQSRAFKGEL